MRAFAVVIVVALGGCNFAVKHPSVTAGIVAGSLGLATCSLTTPIDGNPDTPGVDDVGHSARIKCYGVTAGIGLGLGLLTRLALWLGTEDEDAPANNDTTIEDNSNLQPAPVFVPKRTPPPPEPPKPEPPPPEPVPEPAPEPQNP